MLDAIGADTPAVDETAVNKESAEDMGQEVSDPDDIDALLDSIGADTSAVDETVANKESAEDMSQEISDPDDIDALLDSMGLDTPVVDETAANTDSAESMSQEISDPDDIDALLDSMGLDTPVVDETATNTESAEDMSQEVSDPDDIDALLDSMGVDTPAAATQAAAIVVDNEKADAVNKSIDEDAKEDENLALINNFSDEYVQSFIEADFSDLLADIVEEEADDKNSESDNLVSEAESAEVETNIDDALDGISDDFDIDALIDEVNQSATADNEVPLDIGDDLLDTNLADSEQPSENPAVASSQFIDDETLQELSADFDESTLSQLLNDEKDVDSMVELSPDFTDSNVLADLLADDGQTNTDVKNNDTAVVAGDIKELDNLDFDDLLANIEEENSSSSNDEFELSDNFDIGDDFDIKSESYTTKNDQQDDTAEDFISVDSLLSDSLLDGKPTEPYEKMNIDVGLGEFPEFAGNITEDDLDDDDNGMAAKLDLAKVYIEIGDNENAEVILQDVVSQGDAQQQFDAQQLLDNL